MDISVVQARLGAKEVEILQLQNKVHEQEKELQELREEVDRLQTEADEND